MMHADYSCASLLYIHRYLCKTIHLPDHRVSSRIELILCFLFARDCSYKLCLVDIPFRTTNLRFSRMTPILFYIYPQRCKRFIEILGGYHNKPLALLLRKKKTLKVCFKKKFKNYISPTYFHPKS